MNDLTDAELNEIMTYTGMDILMLMPTWRRIPVVHFGRDRNGIIRFITILKAAGIGPGVKCSFNDPEV
jgi:hypothetical protein